MIFQMIGLRTLQALLFYKAKRFAINEHCYSITR